MNKHSDQHKDWQELRDRIVGLGKESIRKSYYPDLQQRLRELEYSEARYRSLVEDVSDLVWEIDENIRFTYMSPRVRDLLGYEPEEMLGCTPYDFMSPEEAQRLLDTITPVIAAHEPLPLFENTLLRKDGGEVVCEITARPVFSTEGKFSGYRGTNRDITKRKRAEKALLESQRMLSTLMSNLPGMAYRCKNDICWTMVFVSDGSLALTGYQPEELIGNSILAYSELIHPDEREITWQEVQTALSENRPFQLQYRITTKSGDEKWVWEQGRGIYSNDGKLVAIEGLVIDATERKHAEEALRDSENRLTNILSFLPDPTFAIDTEGRVTLWNQAIEKLTGVMAKDIIGKSNYEYGLAIYGERRCLIIDLLQGCTPEQEDLYLHIQREEESILAESHTPLIRPGGAYLWGKASTLYDSEGNVTGAIESVRDVTDRRLAEQALEESEEKFRVLAENAQALIIIIQDGKFAYTNPYFAELSGYTNEELQAIPVSTLIHPDFQELVLDRMRRRMLGESVPSHYEFKMVNRSGTGIWIDYSAAVIEFKGRPAHVGVGYDITQRKEAEEERRAFYRETILSATDGKLSISDRSDAESFLAKTQLELHIHAPADLSGIRSEIESFCKEHQLKGNLLYDYIIGVGEAMDNSLKHAGCGNVYAGSDSDRVWVVVSDKGPGIGALILPKAVLKRGFSTKPSLGLGYSIMLQVADQILLNTDKNGTIVVLIKNKHEELKLLLDSIPDTWASIAEL